MNRYIPGQVVVLLRRPERWKSSLNLSVRCLVFVIFAACVYTQSYRPSVEERTFKDFLVEGTIQAASEGHVLSAYLSPGNAVRLDQLSYLDIGLPTLVSLASALGRVVPGIDYQVTDATVYHILLSLFLLTALIFLLPSVPLLIALGGVAALALSIVFGPMGFVTGQSWGAAYAAIVTGMMLATCTQRLRANHCHGLFLLGLGVVASIGQFIRQEGTLTAYGATTLLLGATWLVAGYLALRDRALSAAVWPVVVRVTIAAASFVGMILLGPTLQRLTFAIVRHVPYAQTMSVTHGAGHNPYIGLGYVSNPYNIAWLDTVGAVHAELAYPEVRFGDSRYQQVMLGEWLHVISESPWLLLTNAERKLASLSATLFSGSPPVLAALSRVAIVTPILGLLVVLYRGDPILLAQYGAFLGMAFLATSPAILVQPGYVAGPRGAVVASAVLLPAMLLNALLQTAKAGAGGLGRRARRLVGEVFAVVAVALAAGLLMGAVWYHSREADYQAQLHSIARANPVEGLQQFEYRYGHFFNALPVADRERIINWLRSSADPKVAVGATADQDRSFFLPIAAVFSEHQLHVFVWLGRGYPGTLSPGTANNFLKVCAGCTALSSGLTYERNSEVHTGVNDLDWQDEYRMFSFPVAPEMKASQSFLVGIQRIAGPGPDGIWGYTLQTVAAGALHFRPTID